MKLYTARLLFRIQKENSQTPDFDEQLIVVRASTAKEARNHLKVYASKESETFANKQGHLIHWIFEEVTALQELHFQNSIAFANSRTLEIIKKPEPHVLPQRINLN